jgi:protein-disulfide isomerase
MVTKKPQNSESEIIKTLSNDFSFTNILLIIVIVLNSLAIYFVTGNSITLPGLSSIGIKESLLEIEYEKSGGRQNYELLTKAQLLSLNDPQNPSNIEAMRQYVDSFGSGGMPTGGPAPVVPTQTATLTGEALQAIIASSVIEGNKEADILVVEYSDMECPFCIRQYQETKLWPSLQTEYGDKVAFAFKSNRGVNHTGTEPKALAALCAKKVGGDEAYVKFYTAIMDGSNNSGLLYDVAKLPELAKAAWIDEAAWKACYDSKETLAQFTSETSEAQSFNLGGTPGTLILNVKTGEYATVEGAYPFTTFTQKINDLLN